MCALHVYEVMPSYVVSQISLVSIESVGLFPTVMLWNLSMMLFIRIE